jgi:hypothetical protein
MNRRGPEDVEGFRLCPHFLIVVRFHRKSNASPPPPFIES